MNVSMCWKLGHLFQCVFDSGATSLRTSAFHMYVLHCLRMSWENVDNLKGHGVPVHLMRNSYANHTAAKVMYSAEVAVRWVVRLTILQRATRKNGNEQ